MTREDDIAMALVLLVAVTVALLVAMTVI